MYLNSLPCAVCRSARRPRTQYFCLHARRAYGVWRTIIRSVRHSSFVVSRARCPRKALGLCMAPIGIVSTASTTSPRPTTLGRNAAWLGGSWQNHDAVQDTPHRTTYPRQCHAASQLTRLLESGPRALFARTLEPTRARTPTAVSTLSPCCQTQTWKTRCRSPLASKHALPSPRNTCCGPGRSIASYLMLRPRAPCLPSSGR